MTANGNDGNDAITGGNGFNNLNGGGPGYDIISACRRRHDRHGGADADTIKGGPGDDLLDGGTGAAFFTDEDLVDYSAATDPMVVNLTGGFAVGQGLDAINDFEVVIGSSQGDILTGDGEANRFLGGAGADVLFGLVGDDFLNGGLGKDSVDGGDNTDTCVHGGDSFASCEHLVGSGPWRF